MEVIIIVFPIRPELAFAELEKIEIAVASLVAVQRGHGGVGPVVELGVAEGLAAGVHHDAPELVPGKLSKNSLTTAAEKSKREKSVAVGFGK